jgi:hypothetical protein
MMKKWWFPWVFFGVMLVGTFAGGAWMAHMVCVC